jgi:nicotinamidase-related amidase
MLMRFRRFRNETGHQLFGSHKMMTPREGEHLVVKKGFGGNANTPLDTILRNMGVATRVVSGVTTCVCVSTTRARRGRA